MKRIGMAMLGIAMIGCVAPYMYTSSPPSSVSSPAVSPVVIFEATAVATDSSVTTVITRTEGEESKRIASAEATPTFTRATIKAKKVGTREASARARWGERSSEFEIRIDSTTVIISGRVSMGDSTVATVTDTTRRQE